MRSPRTMSFVVVSPNCTFEMSQIPDNVIDDFESYCTPKMHTDKYGRVGGQRLTAVVSKLICDDNNETLLLPYVEKLPPWIEQCSIPL